MTDEPLFKGWFRAKSRDTWVDTWLQIEDGTWDANLVLYRHCQDGLHETRERDSSRLAELSADLSGRKEINKDAPQVERYAEEESLRLMTMELRVLRTRLSDIDNKLKPWKTFPLTGCKTIAASRDQYSEIFEIHSAGSQPVLQVKASSTEVRNQALDHIVQAGLKRSLSELTMCHPTGIAKEDLASMRRNQQQDPREKLSTRRQNTESQLSAYVQPPEEWNTPPVASFGCGQWLGSKASKKTMDSTVEGSAGDKKRIGDQDHDVEQTTYFESLHWHRRDLHAVPPGLWEIPAYKKLQYLYLENNSIKELPVQLGTFANLKLLSLSNNQISTIPSWIENLSELHTLNLAHNRVLDFTGEICQLRSLTNLNFFSNSLELIPVALGECTSLTALNLGRNSWQVLAEGEEDIELHTHSSFVEPKYLPLPKGLLEIIKTRSNAMATREIMAYLKARKDGFDAERKALENKRLEDEELVRKELFASDVFKQRKEELLRQQELLMAMK